MRSGKNVLFQGRKKPQRVRLEPNIKRVKQLKIDGFCPFFDRFCPPFWSHIYISRAQIAVLSRAPVSGSGMLRSVIESVNGGAFLGVIRDSWAFVLSQVPKSEGPDSLPFVNC